MRRGLIITVALVVVCAALGLGGSIVALRAAAPQSTDVTLVTVDVQVVPATRG